MSFNKTYPLINICISKMLGICPCMELDRPHAVGGDNIYPIDKPLQLQICSLPETNKDDPTQEEDSLLFGLLL